MLTAVPYGKCPRKLTAKKIYVRVAVVRTTGQRPEAVCFLKSCGCWPKQEREREPEKVPKVLVAENVKALRKLLPVLEAEYGKAGYKCHAQLFNSKYWGVPQNRERYIVVGTLDSLPDTYTYPEEQHDYVPKLSTILEADVDDKFYIADEKAHKIIDQALQRISSMGKVHATITPDRIDKRQNGRRSKEDEDPMFTLTAQDLHGVIVDDTYGYSTERERERERAGKGFTQR